MKNKAFTFVELIVVVTILAILALIWTVSYTWYIWDSRDAKRQANLSEIKWALKLYKQNRGSYPLPSDRFNISYNSDIVAYQWKMWSWVSLSNVDSLPLDPKLNLPYTYSVSKNRTEFQLSASLENSWVPKAIVLWDYKSVSKDTLPSISIATSTWINIASDKNKFIFDNQSFNLPYTFSSPYSPLSASWATFSWVLNDAIAKNTFWQNSDFRSCEEIEESGKLLNSSWLWINYQVIDNNWSTQNVSCNPYDACSSAWQVLQATSTYPWCDTKDIIVCSWVDVWVTLAACNIWATIAWTWSTSNTIWNYFQWWNNYWNISSSSTHTWVLADASWFWPNNYYKSTSFITKSPSYRNDWTTIQNDNLWWWNGTYEERMWPCERWYHVMKQTEWSQISIANNKWNTLMLPNWSYWMSNTYTTYWYKATIIYNSIFWTSDWMDRWDKWILRCMKN